MKEPEFHCVICSNLIDVDRIVHKAVTCSKDCAKVYRSQRRQLINAQRKRCRTCNRPGTPEDWALFRAWSKTLPKKKPGRKKRTPEADPRQIVMPSDLTIH
jgi:predicted nucleic acid-binding Zn ribbon protein